MKTYYMLTKPGIIFGNIITTAAGFALASKGHINFWLFFVTISGLALVIASAGIFNNYIDREADRKMARTKNRPLATGLISNQKALVFASVLAIVGIAILGIYTNVLTVFVALIGFFVYLVLYAFLKYHSFYGTIVGSIAGAVPPVVGYCAVSNHFDMGAFLLFMVLVLWQMPHFFAIAIYRLEDYRAVSVPVLPITKGLFITKIQMSLYIIVFTATSIMLTMLGYTGNGFFAIALALGSIWLALCLTGFKAKNDTAWGKQMFLTSLMVIMVLSTTIMFDTV